MVLHRARGAGRPQSCEIHDRDDYQRARLFMIGTKRAVVIGCIVLYKLAAFNTARR